MTPASSYSHCRREAGLADLLQVLALLQPTQREHLMSVSASVGLEWREAHQPPAHKPETAVANPALSSPVKPLETPTAKLPTMESEFGPGLTPRADTRLLEPTGQTDNAFEYLFDSSWLETADALEPTDVAVHMRALTYQPLLKTRWFRGIMGLILSTRAASRDLDWSMLERHLTDGRPLRALPFRQRPTLKRGVSLFLDRSDSMQPFWRDEKELLGQLKRLFGPRKVQSWWLETASWNMADAQLKWRSPAPGQLSPETPVLVVSNFGSKGEPSGEGTAALKPWLPLFNLAHTYRCPLIALIPAPEPFWPRQLKQYAHFVFEWDHNTSTQSVARQLRGRFR